jgi:hypothetical protein
MSSTSTAAVKFSVEVITLPVSDVERALRFYVDRVGFTLDIDYSPNDAFRVVQLTPPGSGCSIQIGRGLTDAAVGSLRNIYLVVTNLAAVRSHLIERGVEVGEIRHRLPLMPGTGVLHPGLTRRTGITPASPTSRIRMATAGSYRNEGIVTCDVLARNRRDRGVSCIANGSGADGPVVGETG